MQRRNRTVRVLHTSDLHLGEQSYPWVPNGHAGEERDQRTLETIVSVATAERADLLLIAGDVFDHNRVGRGVVDLLLEKLGSLPTPVVILPGNHDSVVPDSVYHRVNFPLEAGNFYVFSALEGETFSFPQLDLAIWGRPVDFYGGDPVRPLRDVPPRGPERWQLAVAHGHYVGGQRNSIYSLQIFDEDILHSGRDYIALGHWDIFTDVTQGPTKAYYSGSPSRFGVAAIVELDPDRGITVTRQGFPEQLNGQRLQLKPTVDLEASPQPFI